jgi:LysM repeat protein
VEKPKLPVKEMAAPAQTEVVYYTIKGGDNPWKIAKQYGVNVDDLLKLNGLNDERAKNLKPGDKIRVK